MTPEWIAQRDALRIEACSGDQSALQFLADLMNAVELWDDLIDRDKNIEKERVNGVFASLIFRLPNIQFWLDHRPFLTPLLIMAQNAWEDSELMATDDDIKARNVAFHNRNNALEIYHACALLTGGWDHMRAMGPRLRRFFAFEAFEDWDKERDHA